MDGMCRLINGNGIQAPFDSSAKRARASTSPLTHADVKFSGDFKVIGGGRGGMVGSVAVRHSRPGNGHRQQTMHLRPHA